MAIYIPTYFSPISQYKSIVNSEEFVFELNDNFQKQTYRNRCYIYGANGKQLLNIPVKHNVAGGRKQTKDTLVANEFDWQAQHFKSLKSAYMSSPFYEFFEDDLSLIFCKSYKYLHDVNMDTFMFVKDALQLNLSFSFSASYELELNDDYRGLAVCKKSKEILTDTFHPKKYKQMFDLKYGFLPNLSILDLLFMEGPNAISFLI